MQYSSDAKILFIHSGHIFTSKNRQQLLGNGKSTLYVKDEDYKKFSNYRVVNLFDLLKTNTLNVQERAELLHESVSKEIHNMFENGINKTAIVNSKLYIESIVKEMVNDRIYSQALLSLTAHDYATYSHSVNVAIYTLVLCKELGYSEDEMIELGTGALLHDIGKSKIPLSIINKPAKLNAKEFQEMKKHPELGYKILLEMGEANQSILDIVRYHHEKLDGSGYLLGLNAKYITQEVQIVTICDIFDALTSNRSYKKAASHFISFKTMKVTMKDQLDMTLLDQLIKLMGK